MGLFDKAKDEVKKADDKKDDKTTVPPAPPMAPKPTPTQEPTVKDAKVETKTEEPKKKGGRPKKEKDAPKEEPAKPISKDKEQAIMRYARFYMKKGAKADSMTEKFIAKLSGANKATIQGEFNVIKAKRSKAKGSAIVNMVARARANPKVKRR